jgi:hypothetical protein
MIHSISVAAFAALITVAAQPALADMTYDQNAKAVSATAAPAQSVVSQAATTAAVSNAPVQRAHRAARIPGTFNETPEAFAEHSAQQVHVLSPSLSGDGGG